MLKKEIKIAKMELRRKKASIERARFFPSECDPAKYKEAAFEYINMFEDAVSMDARSMKEFIVKAPDSITRKEIKKELRRKNCEFFKKNIDFLNIQHQLGITTKDVVDGYFVDPEEIANKSKRWESNKECSEDLFVKVVESIQSSYKTEMQISVYQSYDDEECFNPINGFGEEYEVSLTEFKENFLNSEKFSEFVEFEIAKRIYGSESFFEVNAFIYVKNYITINRYIYAKDCDIVENSKGYIWSHGLAAFFDNDIDKSIRNAISILKDPSMEICCSFMGQEVGPIGIYVKGDCRVASNMDLGSFIDEGNRAYDPKCCSARHIIHDLDDIDYSVCHHGEGIVSNVEIVGCWIKNYSVNEYYHVAETLNRIIGGNEIKIVSANMKHKKGLDIDFDIADLF